ncbi:DUF3108 domain-containing protein [Hyphomicrobium sp. 1Nfss2.1]|uniref:hypothetical protein n=1 Tax=Hyphomicrobium sp. 1Nfss2.1 TaxID=3413936 RepID=UPI003C7CD019
MRFNGLGGLVLVAALALGSSAVAVMAADEAKPAGAAASAQPKATDLIFEQKHLANVEPGKTIDYKFERTVTDQKILGQPFTDDITLKVTADQADGKKDLELQIYSGDRARDLQKLQKFSINPVFAVFFSQAVSTFNQLAGGQVNYLQSAFSNGWLQAKVEPIKVTYNGKEIDAYRISMTPFAGDKYESKMQGWEGAEYAVIVSKDVPGQIVDLLAKYHNRYPPAKLKLTERITLAGVTGLEGTQ